MHLAELNTKWVLNRLDRLALENTRLEANRKADIKDLKVQFNSFRDMKAGVQQGKTQDHIWATLAAAATRGSHFAAEQIILEHLRFDTINDRHDTIRTAHAETFSWLYGTSGQESPAAFGRLACR